MDHRSRGPNAQKIRHDGEDGEGTTEAETKREERAREQVRNTEVNI